MVPISIVLILGFVGLTECSTAKRLEADTRECGWQPNSPKFADSYSEIETKLATKGIPREDLHRLYRIIRDEIGYLKGRSYLTFNPKSVILNSLEQLELSKDLDRRDCFDHCTYVLARNNCNAAISLHACRPLSFDQSTFIKLMLDTKVFSLIDRCQVYLMYHAILLNTTYISADTYKSVRLIAERMIDPNTLSRWNSFADMVLASRKPFFNTRRLIRPGESKFFDQIAQLMIDLEKLSGGDALFKAIDSGSKRGTEAERHYHRLVMQPCVEYIHKMHTAMDATLFYGRISELDDKRFDMVFMSNTMRVKYFELVKLYEACVYLDNANDYTIYWEYEADQLISSEEPLLQHSVKFRKSR